MTENATRVVNKHHGDPFDVYIGRGSIWGNPFPMNGRTTAERAASRREVILRFEQHLLASPELLALVAQLHGKTLQCFCAPKPCHGHVLAHYADALALTGQLPERSAFSLLYAAT